MSRNSRQHARTEENNTPKTAATAPPIANSVFAAFDTAPVQIPLISEKYRVAVGSQATFVASETAERFAIDKL